MSKTRLYCVLTLAIVLILILSACDTNLTSGGDQVEVFSWWTEGSEAAGLEALIQVFNENYPNTEFINATAAETNAQRALATRLQNGQPPDSWQGHAGQELIGTYTANEQIVPLNDLYKEQSWLDVMPKLMFPLISQDGNIYSIPVSIHRTNVLWYNPSLLDANGIPIPATLEDWFSAMDTLQREDVIPLALGDADTRTLLFESILLASLGPEKYSGLWDGSTDWAGADIKFALENYQKALTYTAEDSASLSWQEAAQTLSNGEAAFYVMGDWVEAYFREVGKQPDVDYGWAPAPGTEGIFQFMGDSFVLAMNAPNREGAIDWLKVAGSKQGQEAFNQNNGSICARTDCDPSLFDDYQQSAMEEWANSRIVGSLSYGVVANDAWKSEIDSALALFAKEGDLAVFQTALVDACKKSGACREETGN
jgi:glucose/mannose transport system substrate-binding protein